MLWVGIAFRRRLWRLRKISRGSAERKPPQRLKRCRASAESRGFALVLLPLRAYGTLSHSKKNQEIQWFSDFKNKKEKSQNEERGTKKWHKIKKTISIQNIS